METLEWWEGLGEDAGDEDVDAVPVDEEEVTGADLEELLERERATGGGHTRVPVGVGFRAGGLGPADFGKDLEVVGVVDAGDAGVMEGGDEKMSIA